MSHKQYTYTCTVCGRNCPTYDEAQACAASDLPEAATLGGSGSP